MRANQRRMTAAAAATALLLVSACTAAGPGDHASPGPAAAGELSEGTTDTAVEVPKPAGAGSIAASTPAGATPGKTPAQAGKDLAGKALPTNQWWTSALTGPGTQPLWAHPLAVKAADTGLQVSSAPPAASANAVVTPFVPAVTAGGPFSAVRVVGYGAFHVVLRLEQRGGGTVDATVVQGSPVLYLDFRDTAPSLTVTGEPGLPDGAGDARLRLEVAGQRWDVVADGGTWRRDGNRLTVAGGASGRVALARVPDAVDAPAWTAAIAGSAADPVVDTTARMTYDAAGGSVVQTLAARRASGKPVTWALLPHQQAGLVTGGGLTKLAGGYPDARGTLRLVRATAVQVRVPMPGLLSAVPSVPLPAAARAAVVADLDRDLADPPGAGGSYFGLKELGRLATVAEVAGGVGATAQQDAALARLRPQLVDWLTYSGPQDGRYFAYDKLWGGLVAVPAEFGSQDYNDHHFQYGYLVRAAAVMARHDPAFGHDYRDAVDLVARDYSGSLAAKGAGGFPGFRYFNAYLGHSAGSGFAPFADGNNQESSSEAVAAWEAVARWGLVSGNADLAAAGVTHYALEAATARRYWLGEGAERPPGYTHQGVGIVWDAKLDYATWFDPKPESVAGIQLLPLTFGSLYRADAQAAVTRSAELAGAVGGPPRVWGDLFAADLAVADPAAARARLVPGLPREDSTSRAMVRYWVEVLAVLGRPQPAVVADGPYGLAFGGRDQPTLVAVNPTGEARTVTFRRDGKVVAAVAVDPGRTVTRAPGR
jgi:endo-1,3(4)-beta-glucanase